MINSKDIHGLHFMKMVGVDTREEIVTYSFLPSTVVPFRFSMAAFAESCESNWTKP